MNTIQSTQKSAWQTILYNLGILAPIVLPNLIALPMRSLLQSGALFDTWAQGFLITAIALGMLIAFVSLIQLQPEKYPLWRKCLHAILAMPILVLFTLTFGVWTSAIILNMGH
ncbi:hypothetical protein ACKLNO_01170 [Neisseriaceae bacterium B1]